MGAVAEKSAGYHLKRILDTGYGLGLVLVMGIWAGFQNQMKKKFSEEIIEGERIQKRGNPKTGN
jgi:hypothetical protein